MVQLLIRMILSGGKTNGLITSSVKATAKLQLLLIPTQLLLLAGASSLIIALPLKEPRHFMPAKDILKIIMSLPIMILYLINILWFGKENSGFLVTVQPMTTEDITVMLLMQPWKQDMTCQVTAVPECLLMIAVLMLPRVLSLKVVTRQIMAYLQLKHFFLPVLRKAQLI